MSATAFPAVRRRPGDPAARRDAVPARRSLPVSTFAALIFLGAHVPLALLMRDRPVLSTLHAMAAVAIGLIWAISGKHPHRVACVAAYLAGSEVLWRMTGSEFFWEGAKYGTVLIFVATLVRAGHLKPPVPIASYFALLLPSTALVWLQIGFSQARNVTSFNLSGPLALMVSVWFFSHLRLSWEGITRILFALILPVVGVLTLSFFGIVTSEDLTFGEGSNFATSGGFGPNQVSAVLGLAALAAFVLVLDHARPLLFRAVMLGLLLAFAAQSALTFSRTGVVALVASIGIGCVFLFQNRRARITLAIGLPVLILASMFVVAPRLESMTGGAIGDRFSDTSPTGRDQLARADWLIFLDHPVLGVGPGQAKALRSIAGRVGLSHTEYTRLIAEHGILGLIALCLLIGTAVARFRAATGSRERAIVAMLYSWSALFMLVSGMRLVAPAFAFGLASAMPPRARARVRPKGEVRRASAASGGSPPVRRRTGASPSSLPVPIR